MPTTTALDAPAKAPPAPESAHADDAARRAALQERINNDRENMRKLQQLRIYLQAASQMFWRGEYRRAVEVLQQVAEKCHGIPSGEMMECEALRLCGHCLIRLKQFDAADRCLDMCMDVAKTVEMPALIANVHIAQGQLGDCWLMSALAAAAEYPGAIHNLFVSKEFNERGKYRVRLYDPFARQWRVFSLDDKLPCERAPAPPYTTIFAKPNGRELWALLLEKAAAKLMGGYDLLSGGNILLAFKMLTGDPVFHLSKEKDGQHMSYYGLRFFDEPADGGDHIGKELKIGLHKHKERKPYTNVCQIELRLVEDLYVKKAYSPENFDAHVQLSLRKALAAELTTLFEEEELDEESELSDASSEESDDEALLSDSDDESDPR